MGMDVASRESRPAHWPKTWHFPPPVKDIVYGEKPRHPLRITTLAGHWFSVPTGRPSTFKVWS